MPEPTTGQLNQRIEIEALTQTKDIEGGMVNAWSPVVVGGLWAKVNHFAGNEEKATTQGGGKVATQRTEFTIRHRVDITFNATMRVVFGGKNYNIHHVNAWQELKKFITLTCETGHNNGQ